MRGMVAWIDGWPEAEKDKTLNRQPEVGRDEWMDGLMDGLPEVKRNGRMGI